MSARATATLALLACDSPRGPLTAARSAAPPASVAPLPEASTAPAEPVADSSFPDVLARVAFDPKTGSLAYGPVSTEATISDLRKVATFAPAAVNWHGNRVGERWKEASPVRCASCASAEISLSFFDDK